MTDDWAQGEPCRCRCLTVVASRRAWSRKRKSRKEIRFRGRSMREALLVDDDRGFVETLAMLLRFEGYAVIPQFTFDSAVQYLRASTPEVLITDIGIGASNGWELVRYAN